MREEEMVSAVRGGWGDGAELAKFVRFLLDVLKEKDVRCN